jgi:hypothetical protein
VLLHADAQCGAGYSTYWMNQKYEKNLDLKIEFSMTTEQKTIL